MYAGTRKDMRVPAKIRVSVACRVPADNQIPAESRVPDKIRVPEIFRVNTRKNPKPASLLPEPTRNPTFLPETHH